MLHIDIAALRQAVRGGPLPNQLVCPVPQIWCR